MANDLKSSGKTTIAAGTYGDIDVSGKTTGNGNITAMEFQSSGKTCIAGSLDIRNNVSLSGKNEYENIKCVNLNGNGKLSVDNLINCDKEMIFSGAVHIKEIAARTCSLCIGSHSDVGTIKADNVNVVKTEENISESLKNAPAVIDLNVLGIKFRHELDLDKLAESSSENVSLDVKSIVSKNVDVSYTNADEIIADNITIGKECHIAKVIYRQSYSCDDSSIVDIVEKK